jgi:hypothetical protein
MSAASCMDSVLCLWASRAVRLLLLLRKVSAALFWKELRAALVTHWRETRCFCEWKVSIVSNIRCCEGVHNLITAVQLEIRCAEPVLHLLKEIKTGP